MAALIRFNAADIHLEGVEVDVELPRDWFLRTFADTDVAPQSGSEPAGHIRGRLSRSGNDIVVRARVKAAVNVSCVRCLEPTAAEVDAELSLLLQPKRSESKRGRRHERAEEYEFDAVEADLDIFDGETVILDAFVRERILLEVPTFPLCRESCPGMVSPPGPEDDADSQMPDPRLAPLGAFRQAQGPASLDDLVAAANVRGMAFGRKPVLRSNHAKKKKKKR